MNAASKLLSGIAGAFIILSILAAASFAGETSGATYCFLKPQRLPDSRARIDIVQELPVIHRYGTPEEMGRQYGTLLKGSINDVVNLVKLLLPPESLDSYVAAAKALEKNLPEGTVLQLKAVAGAAGVPYDIILAINMTAKYNCSGLTVLGDRAKDGKMMFCRNLDYFAYGLGHCANIIIVFHPEAGKRLVSLAFVGFIGAYTGINEDGVAFGNMLVFNSAPPLYNSRGVTIHLAFREAAFKAVDTESFCDLIAKMEHVIPMNAMVADGKKACVLEIGAEKMSRRFPERNYIAATNYFLNPGKRSQKVDCERYGYLDALGSDAGAALGVEDMEKALKGSAMGKLNLQAVVFVPADMKMYLSMNRMPPAADGPYREFDIRELLKD